MLNLLRATTLGVMLFALYVGYADADGNTALDVLRETVRAWDEQASEGTLPDPAACERMRELLETAREELAADLAAHEVALAAPPAPGSEPWTAQRARAKQMRRTQRELDERAETIAALETRIGALCHARHSVRAPHLDRRGDPSGIGSYRFAASDGTRTTRHAHTQRVHGAGARSFGYRGPRHRHARRAAVR